MLFAFNDEKKTMVKLEDVTAASLEISEKKSEILVPIPFRVGGDTVYFSSGDNQIEILLRSRSTVTVRYYDDSYLARKDYERFRTYLESDFK